MTPYELDWTLISGKYKGKTVQEVLALDPEYLAWAHENVRGFTLKQDLYEAIVYSNKEYNNPGPVSKYNPWGNPYNFGNKRSKYK